MMLSTNQVARARETVARMLDDMALDAYLFELEPGDDHWQLHLECAADGGWSRLTVSLDADTVAQAADDAEIYARLLEQCAGACAECKKSC